MAVGDAFLVTVTVESEDLFTAPRTSFLFSDGMYVSCWSDFSFLNVFNVHTKD